MPSGRRSLGVKVVDAGGGGGDYGACIYPERCGAIDEGDGGLTSDS